MAVPDLSPLQRTALGSLVARCNVNIVSGWEAIANYLTVENLAWRIRLRPDHVGIHPENRGRFGIDPTGAHLHGVQIVHQGWSWSKCADVAATEVKDPDSVPDAVAMNNSTVDMANGLLPPLTSLKALSIGGWAREIRPQTQSIETYFFTIYTRGKIE